MTIANNAFGNNGSTRSIVATSFHSEAADAMHEAADAMQLLQ